MTSRPGLPPLPRWKKLLFSSLLLLALLAITEAVLRLRGAADRCPAFKDSILWVCDPILSFKPNPHQAVRGQPLINRAGFRSREFGPKRPGVYRIIALGDSCTFGVISPPPNGGLEYIDEPYPQRLDRIAAERLGEGRIEVFNAAVPGYNSFHGVMLLRTKLRGLTPDLITVRFGLNDQGMSTERHVGNAFREPSTAVGRGVEDLLLHTALYPFTKRLGMELRLRFPASRAYSVIEPPQQWVPDIPTDEYEHNLTRIVELGHAQGARVWLLTSPISFVLERFRGHDDQFGPDAPARLALTLNAIASFEQLIEIHAAYNAATRNVGARLGVPVIDMEAIYREHATEPLFGAADVLHPTQAGHNLEAETLYDRLIADHVLDRNR